jgi:Ca2+-binding EF-hand superfamily protein
MNSKSITGGPSMKFISISILSLFVFACSHGGKRHNAQHDKKQMWEEMDTDKDGSVSKTEFNASHEKKFKDLDANSDGKVSAAERDAFQKAKCSEKGQKCSKCADKKEKCSKCADKTQKCDKC